MPRFPETRTRRLPMTLKMGASDIRPRTLTEIFAYRATRRASSRSGPCAHAPHSGETGVARTVPADDWEAPHSCMPGFAWMARADFQEAPHSDSAGFAERSRRTFQSAAFKLRRLRMDGAGGLSKSPHPTGTGFAGTVRADIRAIDIHGAVERSRTSDLLITNQLLYQLSYNGMGRAV